MSDSLSHVAVPHAEKTTRVCAVLWPSQGTVPQWLVSLLERLRSQWNARVDLVATGLAHRGTPCDQAGLAWSLDAKLFGDTPELRLVHTDLAPAAGADAPDPLVLQFSGDSPEKLGRAERCIRFEVAGQPACELLRAVQQAVADGRGDLLLEARFSGFSGGKPVVWQWRAGVDELSIHRTVRNVLELLGELVQLAVKFAHDKQVPIAQSPLAADPPTPVAGSHAWRATRHAMRRALMVDQWGMTVYRHIKPDDWWPESGGLDLLPPPDRFWADPFLVEDGDRLWVFFEELRFDQQKGYLCCLSIDAQGHASPTQVILEEAWHLSYPQVFRHAGRWYLLPESSARRNLMLYSAEQLPGPWHPVAELLTDCRVADATVWQEGGQWHMVASVGTSQGPINDMLQAFGAPVLEGPWSRVAQVPCRVDAATARPAGPRFQRDGKWYRPVQDCRQRYGRATHLLAMEDGAATGMQERVVATLEPRPGSSLQCVHTYCRTENHLAVDWLRWRFKHDTRRIGLDQDISLKIPAAAEQTEAA